jgi:hypothetical protein
MLEDLLYRVGNLRADTVSRDESNLRGVSLVHVARGAHDLRCRHHHTWSAAILM